MPSPSPALYVELLMSVQRVGAAAHDASVTQDAWPPQVVVAHLGDVDEQVWLPRVNAMVAAFDNHAPPPHFAQWEPDPHDTLNRHADSSIDDALAHATASRISLITRLRHLTSEQWSAEATHDSFGELDVVTLMYQVLAHDEEHRASLVFS